MAPGSVSPRVRRGLRVAWALGLLAYLLGGALLWYGPAVVPAFGALLTLPLALVSWGLGRATSVPWLVTLGLQVALSALWLHGPTTVPPWLPDWAVMPLFLYSVAVPAAFCTTMWWRLRRPVAPAI